MKIIRTGNERKPSFILRIILLFFITISLLSLLNFVISMKNITKLFGIRNSLLKKVRQKSLLKNPPRGGIFETALFETVLFETALFETVLFETALF